MRGEICGLRFHRGGSRRSSWHVGRIMLASPDEAADMLSFPGEPNADVLVFDLKLAEAGLLQEVGKLANQFRRCAKLGSLEIGKRQTG
jgi:hypothetical protein